MKQEDPTAAPPPARRAALVGLLLVVLLILAGLLLTHLLGKAARLQDCVLSGRSDCHSSESTDGR